MKKIISTILFLGVLCTGLITLAESPIRIVIGGSTVVCDVPPVIINDRVMVPVRVIFEKIGASVTYDNGTVTATKRDKIVELVIGSDIITVNGEQKTIDSPAIIENDRTLVPVRACAEAFDLEVKWLPDSHTVKVITEVSLPAETVLSDGTVTYKCTYNEDYTEKYVEFADGSWSKYIYDDYGNRTYVELANSSMSGWTKWEYDNRNNIIYEETPYGWKKYTYDEENRLISYASDDGYLETHTYDDRGNELLIDYIQPNDPNPYWKKYTYDEYDRKIMDEDTYGNYRYYKYDEYGNLILINHPDGTTEKYEYDQYGNKTYFEKYITEDNKTCITYTYNEHGLLTSWTVADHSLWEKKEYDEQGRIIYEENNWGDSTKYTYDKNGNIIYKEYSGDGWTKYTYDEYNNLTYKESNDGSWEETGYDENGNILYIANNKERTNCIVVKK